MLTPNRRGISPLPGDIFYSQVMDVNYMAGLTWTRQPGFRVLLPRRDKRDFWSLGGRTPTSILVVPAAARRIVLPAAFTGLSGTQLDQGNLVLCRAPAHARLHRQNRLRSELALPCRSGGVVSTFKIINTQHAGGPNFTKTGGGIQAGFNGEIFPGFRLITTNFWGDGEGRYLFGQAPDVVVTANWHLEPAACRRHRGWLRSQDRARSLLFAYYGGIYIGRDTVIDANGKLVGYGYTGSANSQNRAIQEGHHRVSTRPCGPTHAMARSI